MKKIDSKAVIEQLDFLQQEIKMIQENIYRVNLFKNDLDNIKHKPTHSFVLGELKHRLTALKQRIVLVCEINTSDLF